MMQENLINPQAVDSAVKSLFGSYEKFVMHLIQRRHEIENEKKKLQLRTTELIKEENLIKKVLTGFHGRKINGLFYDVNSNGFSENKPPYIQNRDNVNITESISHLLKLNQQMPELEEAAPERKTIREKALFDYKNSALKIIKQNYLPQFSISDLEKEVLDLNKLNKAFQGSQSPAEFADSFAREFNLKSVKKQGVKMR